MAATFGAGSPPITAPDGGFVQEHSEEDVIETASIRNDQGVEVKFVVKPMITSTANIKGYGDPVYSGVTAGNITEDTYKVVEAKGSESNDDFPMFDITAKKFSNYVAPE